MNSSDLQHLEPSEFLNDTVIDFKLKKMAKELFEQDPSLRGRVHFFNTFFFKKLTQGPTPASGGGRGRAKKPEEPEAAKARADTEPLPGLLTETQDRVATARLTISCCPLPAPTAADLGGAAQACARPRQEVDEERQHLRKGTLAERTATHPPAYPPCTRAHPHKHPDPVPHRP